MSWKKLRLAAKSRSTWSRIWVATRPFGQVLALQVGGEGLVRDAGGRLDHGAGQLGARPELRRSACWLMIIGPRTRVADAVEAWPDRSMPAIVLRSALPLGGSVRVSSSPGW